jgi:hypothetical protein
MSRSSTRRRDGLKNAPRAVGLKKPFVMVRSDSASSGVSSQNLRLGTLL